jgi:hypothetical protein
MDRLSAWQLTACTKACHVSLSSDRLALESPLVVTLLPGLKGRPSTEEGNRTPQPLKSS